ncbi:MAG TPA: FtsX-like permease family protein [Planctomycetota bacterium]|nr:FtsX-like permease family protein [Planctomycetota bacterium]
MYILSVALRHLRSRSITWVASAMIAVVVVLYLLIISVLEGSKQHWMDKLQSIMAHATIGVGELAWGIQKPEQWADEIQKVDPGIRGVTIGLESPAMAIFDNARTVGTMRGIDLERELKHGRLKETLFPKDIKEFGVHEQDGRKLPGCIVGGAWRRSYGLKIGGRVTFLFSDEEGEARSRAFAIIGFFEGKNPYLETAAYVDRKYIADLIGVPGRAKTLYVWLNEPNRPDLKKVRDNLREKTRELVRREGGSPRLEEVVSVDTWQEKDNKFYLAITSENRMMRIIMGIFLALLAFIMFLIFGRLVAEKVRDIGALRAMGATPRGILACFLTQALFIGGLGLIAGLIGAFFMIHYLNGIVDFIAQTFRIDIFPGEAFGADRILTLTLPSDILIISVLTIFSALIGAYLPAMRAARLNPVECLRHE